MCSIYRRIGAVAALALVSSLALAGTAGATHNNVPGAVTLSCGAVITVDTVLAADVGPCGVATGTNGALTIKSSGTAANPPTLADYVTLDLNGHKVFGCNDANPQGPCNQPNSGLLISDQSLVAPYVTGEGPGIVIDGQNYVKITDTPPAPPIPLTPGTVTGFDTGIVIRGGSNNVIEKLDVKNNVGSAVTNSDYGEGIGIYTSTGGLLATGSTNNKVTGNNVEGNGPYAGVALYNFSDVSGAQAAACATTGNTIGGPTAGTAGDGNTVKDNYVVPNGTTYQDDGIRVEPDVCNSVVQNNTVTGSSLDGIAVFAKATGTQVKDNVVRGNGAHPLLSQRKGDGIRVFLTANGCTVSGNTVGGTNSGSTGAAPPPSSVQGNAGNGIRVDASGCAINGNATVRGNGFNVLVASTPVADPRGVADPNGQYAYYDLRDGNGNCTANTWGAGNDASGTSNPPCIP